MRERGNYNFNESSLEARDRKLRTLRDRIEHLPSPLNVLEARAEEEFVNLLRARPPFPDASKMWELYRTAGGYDQEGNKTTFELSGGKQVTVPTRKFNRLEELRDQIQD